MKKTLLLLVILIPTFASAKSRVLDMGDWYIPEDQIVEYSETEDGKNCEFIYYFGNNVKSVEIADTCKNFFSNYDIEVKTPKKKMVK